MTTTLTTTAKKKTFTIDEIKDTFLTSFTEDQQTEVWKSYDKIATKENCAEMLAEYLGQIPQEQKQNWSPMDKMTWAVRCSYLHGAMQATEIMVRAIIEGIAELTGIELDQDLEDKILTGKVQL